MNAKPKKVAATLVLMAILLSFALANIRIAFSNSSGGNIDLFTQKEPYSGKGQSTRSDAFAPDEIVILYGLATYNDLPVQNALVAFHVALPNNASFSLTARTNSTGIATVNFTVLTPPISINESDIFGEWHILANVLIDGVAFQDILTFKVDYIVKLLSIRTIDENLTYRTYFGQGGDIGLEVTLRSIAMTMKCATLAITIKDELGVPVNYTEVNDLDVQPNEKLVFLYFKLQIPKWASSGNATVNMSALTCPVDQNGVPYCPPVSADFIIMPGEPLTIAFHDAALVNVAPSATSVELGQPLSISVLVRNEGTETESFNVTAYFGGVPVGTSEITGLLPYSKLALNFTVNTLAFDLGNHIVTASIPKIPNEADLSDNAFADGIVEIKPAAPPIIHNVAIANVVTSNSNVYIGELLQINVTVTNKGTETETFNTSAYYDSSLIGTVEINALASSTQLTLAFAWNTSFINAGFYQISALASLSNDIDVSDNAFVDGFVEVRTKPPPPPPVHDIAVMSVVPWSSSVYVGDILDVNVTLKNNGDVTESFNVWLYYDQYSIGQLRVQNLTPTALYTLIFHWNTNNVPKGNYTLSAYAEPVAGEVNTANNAFTDGKVTVVMPTSSYFNLDWFNWFLLLLLVLLLILLIIWFLYRRRKKGDQEVFYSGWTAWYYGYDLPNRRHKLRR